MPIMFETTSAAAGQVETAWEGAAGFTISDEEDAGSGGKHQYLIFQIYVILTWSDNQLLPLFIDEISHVNVHSKLLMERI